MAGPIQTGNIPRSLEEGIHAHFDDSYNVPDQQYTKIFDVQNSRRAFEIDQQLSGYAVAGKKDEGASITYDSQQEGISPKYVMDTIALGFITSMEALNDNQYNLFTKGAKALGWSMNQAKETRGANVLNRGFNSGFTMVDGDGQPLFSTAHVNGPDDSTTYSNTLATPASLSETALEELTIKIKEATNGRGLNIALKPVRLIVPPKLGYEACRITDSVLQNYTANNAINAMRHRSTLRDGYTENVFLSSDTAWFVKTDCPEGLTHFEREKIMFGRDRDFGTFNIRFQAYERYKQGWSNARGCYGSEGV